MNMMEPILMAMLLLLGVFGIVNMTFLTSRDDNIRSVLETIDYLKFTILFLPLPVWIICVLINKCFGPNKNPVQTETDSFEVSVARNVDSSTAPTDTTNDQVHTTEPTEA